MKPCRARQNRSRRGSWGLLVDLRRNSALPYLFISHDLQCCPLHVGSGDGRVSRRDRRIRPGRACGNAAHPIRASCRPPVHRSRPAHGKPRRSPATRPIPIDPPTGCRFHPRCPFAEPVCAKTSPSLSPAGDVDHRAACLMITPGGNRRQPCARNGNRVRQRSRRNHGTFRSGSTGERTVYAINGVDHAERRRDASVSSANPVPARA